ncbi:MAG: hypothetical protein HRT89_07950 [Lentisphaeria bacterium]|nr:hypothetical protein [Lentisphaeria bacterium]NQZ67987.1 hypothetical protein [Lentisphaeria bacterium]
MKKRVLILVSSLMIFSGQADEKALAKLHKSFGGPVTIIPKPEKAPVIDGKLDDAAWKLATPLELKYLTGLLEKPSQKTIGRILADEKNLYISFDCAENDAKRMIIGGKKRDGKIWQGDSVEIFLDPGHKEKRYDYYHILINPKGLFSDIYKKKKSWNGKITVKTVIEANRWTVECVIPMADLGLGKGIPKVWGINLNRHRPELGAVHPAGGGISMGVQPKIKNPELYREGEDTAWSPTLSYSNHIVQRFGHAQFAVATIPVKAPKKVFDLVLRLDFEDGKIGPFTNAVISEKNFRGKGKSIQPEEGVMHLNLPLKDLDDMTLIYCLKLSKNERLYYYGRAPDDMQCEADRHEIFMTPAVASKRKFPDMATYHTHASQMAWKPEGRLRACKGPWKMMSGHFSEPSIGSVMYPGTDWVIVRTQVGQFRRQVQQNVVPMEQNYPRGLTFNSKSKFVLDNVILFRGVDQEAPSAVTGITKKIAGDTIELSWTESKDNTLVYYYEIRSGKTVVAQSRGLTVKIPKAKAKDLSIVAYDLYNNQSKPVAIK